MSFYLSIAGVEERIRYDGIFIISSGRLLSNEVRESTAGLVAESDSLNPLSFGIDETFDFEIPFTFGTAFDFRAVLTTQTSAIGFSPGDDLTMLADGDETAAWGGFSSIRLEDGTLVGDFTAFGQTSGIDMRFGALQSPDASVVPEPSSLALLGFGAVGLIGYGRRRKSNHA